MNDEIINIKPGHYYLKSSLNKEHKEMINVRGRDKNKNGYWRIDEPNAKGEWKTLSEYQIHNDYVPVDVSYKEKPVNKKAPDLGDLDSEIISVSCLPSQQGPLNSDSKGNISNKISELKPLKVHQRQVNQEANITTTPSFSTEYIQVQLPTEEIKIEDLILNKYSTNQQLNLTEAFNIPIRYDLNKLSAAIKLLDDLDVIYICDRIIDDILKSCDLRPQLHTILMNNLLPKLIKIEPITTEPIIPQNTSGYQPVTMDQTTITHIDTFSDEETCCYNPYYIEVAPDIVSSTEPDIVTPSEPSILTPQDTDITKPKFKKSDESINDKIKEIDKILKKYDK